MALRRVVMFHASSIDGMAARADGAIDWLFHEDAENRSKCGDCGFADFLATIDTIVMGRKSYESILAMCAYPHADKRTYVFSRTRTGTDASGVRFVCERPRDLLARLRAEPGRDIWLLGGSDLTSQFAQEGLVDRLVLAIHPIALGTGLSLFGPVARDLHFVLERVRVYRNGLVGLTYSADRDGHYGRSADSPIPTESL